MNFPSDTIQGSPHFHTKVEKQSDGSYKAICNIPEVPEVTAPSESEVIRKVHAAVEAFFGHGGRMK